MFVCLLDVGMWSLKHPGGASETETVGEAGGRETVHKEGNPACSHPIGKAFGSAEGISVRTKDLAA